MNVSNFLWKLFWLLAILGAMMILTVVHVWLKYIRKPKKIGFPEYPVWAVHNHASDPPAKPTQS